MPENDSEKLEILIGSRIPLPKELVADQPIQKRLKPRFKPKNSIETPLKTSLTKRLNLPDCNDSYSLSWPCSPPLPTSNTWTTRPYPEPGAHALQSADFLCLCRRRGRHAVELCFRALDLLLPNVHEASKPGGADNPACRRTVLPAGWCELCGETPVLWTGAQTRPFDAQGIQAHAVGCRGLVLGAIGGVHYQGVGRPSVCIKELERSGAKKRWGDMCVAQ